MNVKENTKVVRKKGRKGEEEPILLVTGSTIKLRYLMQSDLRHWSTSFIHTQILIRTTIRTLEPSPGHTPWASSSLPVIDPRV